MYHLIVFRVFLLISWNLEIVSLKIACEDMHDENFENSHEQWYAIKFCVKLQNLVTEIKAMLDAADTESAMSRTFVYHWYEEFKSSKKSAELMGGPGATMTVLTE